ncbi:MAG: MBL fold metallo-hydrolase [Planctomycetota bacterium]
MTIDRRNFLRYAAGTAAMATGLPLPAAKALAGLMQDESGRVLPWIELDAGPGKAILVSAENVPGGNAMIVHSGPVVMVVDTKFPAFAGSMLADADELANEGIVERHLINTHHHADHTAGNYAFIKAGWNSIAHIRAIARIQAQFDQFVQRAKAAPAMATQSGLGPQVIDAATRAASTADELKPKDFTPKTRFSGKFEPLVVGNVVVRQNSYSTGHTDGDMFVHLINENIVHTGDLVFNGMNPFCDANGGVSFDNWIITLRGLYNLCDEDTRVIPGHGPIAGREIIRTQMNYFEQLRESVNTERKKGTSREDMVQMTFPFQEGLGFDRGREIAIGVMYDTITGIYQG